MRYLSPRRLLSFFARHWLALLLLGFLVAFLIYPMVYVFPAATHYQETVFENGNPVFVGGQPLKRDVWTPFFFLSLVQNDFLWLCLRNSLLVAALATLFTTLISLPLAYWFTRRRFWGQTLLAGLLLAPLVLPPFVGALGLERFLNPYGTLNLWLIELGLMDERQPIDWLGRGGLAGIVLMEVLHLYPIMYLNVAASLAHVDPTMEEAARNLGASDWRVFRTVTFPLMLPGYFAGATIVFVWAFTDLGTPLVFNYAKVIPVQIFNQISERETNPLGYALVVVTLLITATLFYGARFFLGRGDYVMMSKGGVGTSTRSAGRVQALLIWAAVALLTFVAVIPHLGVVLMSITARWSLTPFPTEFTFDNYRLVLDEKIAFLSIKNSLQYSLASTALDAVLGVAIAYLVVRRPSRLTPLLDGLAILPLALPGLVLAFGYLTCYNRLSLFGWEFGRLLDPARNPTLLLIIAYTVRRLPYVTRSALAGLQQIAPDMEEAAENLGAGRWRVFRTVTLPLLYANLLAGAILTFAFALLEVSDSLMLAQQEKYMPITRAIFGFWTRPDDGPYIASAMGVLGMAILLVSMLAASVVLGRKMGELFKA